MTDYELKRRIPVEEGFDVVVAGGGPAGCAAAICAARLGAKVVLLEATGCLGGMGTSGLVTAFDPMANGERMLVGGFMRELIETMYQRGFLKPRVDPNSWRKHYMVWIPFKSEGLKLLLDDLTADAGVEVRFFTKVIDSDSEPERGVVNGIISHNIEGYRYFVSKTYVDCTGDAVLAKLCGVDCREAGHDTPNIMPPTLCSLHAGIQWDSGLAGAQHEDALGKSDAPWRIVQHEALEKAITDDHFTQSDRHLVGGLVRVGETVGYLNIGHPFGTDALNCRSLSDAMVWGRKVVREYLDFYKKYVHGCENMELVTTADLLGVRESRRIVGEYELSQNDYLSRRQFPDQIGVFNKFVDNHPYNASAEEYERFQREKNSTLLLGPGECFGIPYSILVPKGFRNLWVAGRCNSSDVAVHGAIRVMPAASMMGQAVGTAAVQSIETKQPACDLNTQTLIESLRKRGAYLPQEKTLVSMTRS